MQSINRSLRSQLSSSKPMHPSSIESAMQQQGLDIWMGNKKLRWLTMILSTSGEARLKLTSTSLGLRISSRASVRPFASLINYPLPSCSILIMGSWSTNWPITTTSHTTILPAMLRGLSRLSNPQSLPLSQSYWTTTAEAMLRVRLSMRLWNIIKKT